MSYTFKKMLRIAKKLATHAQFQFIDKITDDTVTWSSGINLRGAFIFRSSGGLSYKRISNNFMIFSI